MYIVRIKFLNFLIKLKLRINIKIHMIYIYIYIYHIHYINNNLKNIIYLNKNK
jgi:hypothetical protein